MFSDWDVCSLFQPTSATSLVSDVIVSVLLSRPLFGGFSDGDVRSLIQPSWPSATSLVSAVIITSVLAYLCTSAATVVCPRACTILVVVTVNAHGSCWTLGY